MSDEPKDGQPSQPGDGAPDAKPASAPGLDPEALKSGLQDALKAALPSALEDLAKAAPPRPPAPDPATPPTGKPDPMLELLAPYIAPLVGATQLQTHNALDAATFYSAHPHAVKYREAIEGKMAEAVQAGVRISRADVFKWLRGDKFDEFVQDALKEREEKVKEARLASSASGGARPMGEPAKDPFLMDDKELEGLLKETIF